VTNTTYNFSSSHKVACRMQLLLLIMPLTLWVPMRNLGLLTVTCWLRVPLAI
jgi:hypothetical protein